MSPDPPEEPEGSDPSRETVVVAMLAMTLERAKDLRSGGDGCFDFSISVRC